MTIKGIFFVLATMLVCSGLLFADDQRATAVDAYNPAHVTDAPQSPAQPFAKPTPPSTQAILYDNGPIITHPGGGAGGADGSALQTALSLTIFGFGHQGLSTVNNKVADDFTITDDGGWTIDSLCFYGYQSFSGLTSTFTAVKWWIYNGDPSMGGTVVCTDSATLVNGRLSTGWSGIYRATDVLIATNTDRPVMLNRVVVSPACVLDPGTYWVVWQSWGTSTSGPWCPPITILGSTTTGDALQFIGGTTNIWQDCLDGTFPQGVPFMVKGTVNSPAGVPCSAITGIAARCIGGGTKTVQARVNLLGSTIYAGQMVTIAIDEDQYTSVIVTNGTHSRANFSISGVYTTGDHVVTLVDPPDCGLGDTHATCATAGKSDPTWDDDAEWSAVSSTPQETKLLGNYPNPFNPTTNIQYSLGEATHVTLRVYNTLGQVVATLVNDVQGAGYKSVVWNGKNDSGAPVASGLYIYTLTAGNVVKSDRMLFMK